VRCKAGQLKLGGRCRPARIRFGAGRRVVAVPGTVTFTVPASSFAAKALRTALKRHKALSVTAILSYQSARGGPPVSHSQSISDRL